MDRFLAKMIADIGDRYNWESWKWAGYKVKLKNLPKSNLRFDALKHMYKIPKERGGLICRNPIVEFQTPAMRAAYLDSFENSGNSEDPVFLEEELIKLEAHILRAQGPLPIEKGGKSLRSKAIDHCKIEAKQRCIEALSAFALNPAKEIDALINTLHREVTNGYVTRNEIQRLVSYENQLRLTSYVNRTANTVQLDIKPTCCSAFTSQLEESSEQLLNQLQRGIECGLLNADTIQSPMHHFHVQVETQKLMTYAILERMKKGGLMDSESYRFYYAAVRLLNSHYKGNTELNLFFKGLGSIESFYSSEWGNIRNYSISYRQIQDAARSVLDARTPKSEIPPDDWSMSPVGKMFVGQD